MPSPQDLPYDTRIVNLLTNQRYSLAEVIARHARSSGCSLDEADAYIKGIVDQPTSNLRVEQIDADDVDDAYELQVDAERAAVAARTLLATTTMLDSNVPSPPMQERLRRLAHAAVEDLEQFYFGTGADDADHPHHAHDHGHSHDHD